MPTPHLLHVVGADAPPVLLWPGQALPNPCCCIQTNIHFALSNYDYYCVVYLHKLDLLMFERCQFWVWLEARMRQGCVAKASRIALSVTLSLSMTLGCVPLEAWAEALDEAGESVEEVLELADEEQAPEAALAEEASPLPDEPDVVDEQDPADQPTEPAATPDIATPEEEASDDPTPPRRRQ